MRLIKSMTTHEKGSPARVGFAIQLKSFRRAWQSYADECRKNPVFGPKWPREDWAHVSYGIAEELFEAGICLGENGRPRRW